MSYKRPRRDSDARPEIALSGPSREDRTSIGSAQDPAGLVVVSPKSDSSTSSSRNITNATSRWFGLLASDVSHANHSFASPLLSARQYPYFHRTSVSPRLSSSVVPAVDTPQEHPAPSDPLPHVAQSSSGEARLPMPKSLPEHEHILLEHYIHHVSGWMDLNDPLRHFSILVPRLAVQDAGLMKAIMAMSARDLTIKPKAELLPFQPSRNMAVEYYHETLQYLQTAMKDESYLRSDELLATILIISTYELIDGAGQAWERHLKGAFGVLRSLEITGESGGFKQAVWWSWLRQDLWAAFREHRKLFSSYTTNVPLSSLDEWGLAERSVYLCAQCVNFASGEEIAAGKSDPSMRIAWAEQLEARLEQWFEHLTPHFHPLPSSDKPSECIFKPVFIHPPALGMFSLLDKAHERVVH